MPNQGLCVITHNGKLPSQGGLRLGYGVPGLFFIKAGTTVMRAWPWTLPPAPVPVRKAEIDRWGYIFCTRCGTFKKVLSYGETVIPKKLVNCPDCDTEYLAYRG